MSNKLQGVIAAVATAVDDKGEPDCARSTALARFLLDNGCDGLNVLGTTGEATSFSLEQRKRVMTAYRDAGLPLDRLMVGTGAASVADAVALTRHAAELGFAGALVLPPFYYKGVPDDGLVAYVETIVQATAAKPIPIYLYHFPAQSGLPWHVKLVKRLLDAFGDAHRRARRIPPATWPMRARPPASRRASRCFRRPKRCCWRRARAPSPAASPRPPISTPISARAPGVTATQPRSMQAVAIRKLFDGKQLVPGVKALLAHIHGDPAWARVQPPLSTFPAADRAAVVAGYDGVRAKRVA